MTKPYPVEVVIDDNPRRQSLSDVEVRGMVRIEELRLERTKFRMVGLMMSVFFLSIAATCIFR